MANTPTILSPANGAAVTPPFTMQIGNCNPGYIVEVVNEYGELVKAVQADGAGNASALISSFDGSKLGAAGLTSEIYEPPLNPNLFSTYLLTNSDPPWWKGGTAGYLPTITPNFATDPAGGNTAARLQVTSPGGSDGGNLINRTPIPASAGQTYCFSYWVKRNGATPGPHFGTGRIETLSGTGHSVPGMVEKWSQTSTNWTRLYFTGTIGPADTTLRLWLVSTAYMGVTDLDLLFWGLKCEIGSTPTGDEFTMAALGK